MAKAAAEKPARKAPETPCPHCGAMVHPRAKMCPSCGKEIVRVAKEKKTGSTQTRFPYPEEIDFFKVGELLRVIGTTPKKGEKPETRAVEIVKQITATGIALSDLEGAVTRYTKMSEAAGSIETLQAILAQMKPQTPVAAD